MNPYKIFLDAVEFNDDYSVQTALNDWLESLGPLVIPQAVAGREARKPWLHTPEEDIELLNSQENMNRISKNFCSWLRKLPGDDSIVNEFSEDVIRHMFDATEDGVEDDDEGRLDHVHKYWGRIATSLKLIDSSSYFLSSSRPQIDLKALSEANEVLEEERKQRSPGKTVQIRNRNYGAWYLKPRNWSKSKELKNGSDQRSLTSTDFEHNATMKAFSKYLSAAEDYKNSKLIKEIFL